MSRSLWPLPPEHPLRTLDNVILTPHMIGHTQDVLEAIPGALENIERIMTSKAPLCCRNPEALPAWRERLERIGMAAR